MSPRPSSDCEATVPDGCEPKLRVIERTGSQGKELLYVYYDAEGRPSCVTLDADKHAYAIRYSYDDVGRLEKIEDQCDVDACMSGYHDIVYHPSGRIQSYEYFYDSYEESLRFDERGLLLEKTVTEFGEDWVTTYDYSFREDDQVDTVTITETNEESGVRAFSWRYIYDESGLLLSREFVDEEDEVLDALFFDRLGNAALSYRPGADSLVAYFAGQEFFHGQLLEPTDLSLAWWPSVTAENPFAYELPASTPDAVATFSHIWQDGEFRADYAFDDEDRFSDALFEWEEVSIAMSLDRCEHSATQTIESDSGSVDEQKAHYYYGCASAPPPAEACLMRCEP